jgi:hypothetical protein
MKIEPKCLTAAKGGKGAAYTSDGFMLPCCWMDDPPVYDYVVNMGLKDPKLALKNNKSLTDIFTSEEWENFFQIIVNKPEEASYMCKKKCGTGFPDELLALEAVIELRKII